MPDPTYNIALPMPGTQWDGGIVIASGWFRDDDEQAIAGVMTLRPSPRYYRIGEYDLWDHGQRTWAADYANIVPAAAEFEDLFGLWSGFEDRVVVT